MWESSDFKRSEFEVAAIGGGLEGMEVWCYFLCNGEFLGDFNGGGNEQEVRPGWGEGGGVRWNFLLRLYFITSLSNLRLPSRCIKNYSMLGRTRHGEVLANGCYIGLELRAW